MLVEDDFFAVPPQFKERLTLYLKSDTGFFVNSISYPCNGGNPFFPTRIKFIITKAFDKLVL